MTTEPGTGNQGIIISGSGTVNAGAMAAGQNARAVNRAGSSSDDRTTAVIAQLEDFLQQLSTASADGHIPPDLVETGQAVRAELGKEKRNKHTVMALIRGIGVGVAGVAHLATAAAALETAIGTIIYGDHNSVTMTHQTPTESRQRNSAENNGTVYAVTEGTMHVTVNQVGAQ
ncbi:hypothetical protein ABH935_008595 [Catenulispora sp. GAS73]